MSRRAAYILTLLVSGAALGGCFSPQDSDTVLPAQRGAMPRPTVVALIDSGITPYHDAFRAPPGGPRVDDHLNLAPGAELVLDARQTHYEPGKLYGFSGTRIFAIAFRNTSDGSLVLDERDHGTGTASLVAREDPNALIVMIQVEGNGCPAPPNDCPVYPPLAEAMEWAALQPWIDIISVSMAPPANVPTATSAFPDTGRYLSASKLAHDSGKIVVTAAGNQAVPSTAQHMAGPPWVIAVGGFLPKSQGETLFASKGVDVVANSTDIVAAASSQNETRTAVGTSVATPIVAGTLSRALYEVRSALQHREGIAADGTLAVGDEASSPPVRLTSKDFSDALNATAVHVAPTAWDPTISPSNGTGELLDRSLPILLPPAQMGWGYVHGGLASEIAAWVLLSDHKLPESKALAAAFQAQRQAAREAYWRT